jgi:hypothetical protein
MSDIVRDGPLSVYIGGGSAPDIGRGGALLDLYGLIGGELRFSAELSSLGIFAEAALGASIGLGRDSRVRAAVGLIGLAKKQGKVESAEGLG